MISSVKRLGRTLAPAPLLRWYWANEPVRTVLAFLAFVLEPLPGAPLGTRLRFLGRILKISREVPSPHNHHEILRIIRTILRLPRDVKGCIVEAGCFKGGSTAKFSLGARLAGRELVVFDSFQGLPANDEAMPAGDYRGSLEEVKSNVARYGALEVCRFVEGWFEDTMPHLSEPVAVVYMDTDLASSTRTCLKYLYPRLQPGGVIFSQDGHFKSVVDLLRDEVFWRDEFGAERLEFQGLGRSKLIWATRT